MYNLVKITVYLIGFLLVAYFYFKVGIKGFTHTAPPTFVISSIVFLVSFFWMIIDQILSSVLRLFKTDFRIHYYTIFISLLICVFIFFDSIFN